ncbi:MAG TPA: hypothetical protein VH210_17175 [Gaiellaceae bacterium]|nr:hypothetical protein [Gaiellaceae bacterium]
MRVALISLVAALASAAAFVPAAGATNECHGIQACIRVVGPWVVVPARGSAVYLLSCPGGRSIVGGLDAQVTSRDVRIGFDGRLGAPVQPGSTTTRYALFRAVSFSNRVQAFQPLLGCVPLQGGGGRSTVSAYVSPPGPSLEYRSRIAVLSPGSVGFAKVSCTGNERIVGSWQALAFRTKNPPSLDNAGRVHATKVVVGKKVVVSASASDGLSIDAHAIVQAGAECAP